jgi:hypothetical protein
LIARCFAINVGTALDPHASIPFIQTDVSTAVAIAIITSCSNRHDGAI